MYLEPTRPNGPCFGWKGLLLEGSTPKTKDKAGKYTIPVDLSWATHHRSSLAQSLERSLVAIRPFCPCLGKRAPRATNWMKALEWSRIIWDLCIYLPNWSHENSNHSCSTYCRFKEGKEGWKLKGENLKEQLWNSEKPNWATKQKDTLWHSMKSWLFNDEILIWLTNIHYNPHITWV